MTKKRRAPASGMYLDPSDAALVKGMLLRGDRQHDIASYFGVNAGRVAEIATGAKFYDVDPAAKRYLPPPGPYMSGRDSAALLAAIRAAKGLLTEAERRLRVEADDAEF